MKKRRDLTVGARAYLVHSGSAMPGPSYEWLGTEELHRRLYNRIVLTTPTDRKQ